MTLSLHRNFSLRSALGQSLVAFAALALGCGAEQQVLLSEPPPMGSDAASDPSTTVVGPAPSGGLDGGVIVESPLDASSPSVDAGSPLDASAYVEVCDGIDNDLNGTVDDIDVMQDGICDCLKIATLGAAGGSSESNIFGNWLNSRSDSPAVALAGQTLTPDLLRPYQIIVSQDLNALGRTYSDAEIDALEQWVRAGGGLMTLIGYAAPTERANANAILARFDLSYGDQPILPRTSTSTIPVTTWLGPHPVVQGISRVGVDNGYEVLGSGTTLASEGGLDLLKVQEVGAGHLIVWGDEWITYDSEWAQQTDYQVEQFWVNMIKWLTVAKVCQVPPVVI